MEDDIIKSSGKIIISWKYNIIISWKYNIRRNVNSDIPIVTMRRVANIFFELEVVKTFIQKF